MHASRKIAQFCKTTRPIAYCEWRVDVNGLPSYSPGLTTEDRVMATDKELITQEKRAYEAMKEDLLKEHRGKFVLLKDGQPQGFFASHSEAYTAGVEKYGIDAVFLVQEVTKTPDPSVSLTWQLGLLHVQN